MDQATGANDVVRHIERVAPRLLQSFSLFWFIILSLASKSSLVSFISKAYLKLFCFPFQRAMKYSLLCFRSYSVYFLPPSPVWGFCRMWFVVAVAQFSIAFSRNLKPNDCYPGGRRRSFLWPFDEYTTFLRNSSSGGDTISSSGRQGRQDDREEDQSTAENRAKKVGTFNNGKPLNVAPKAPAPFPQRQGLFEDSHSLSTQTSQAPRSSRLSPFLPSSAQNRIESVAENVAPHKPLQQTAPTLPPIDTIPGTISQPLGFSGTPAIVGDDFSLGRGSMLPPQTQCPQMHDPMILEHPTHPLPHQFEAGVPSKPMQTQPIARPTPIHRPSRVAPNQRSENQNTPTTPQRLGTDGVLATNLYQKMADVGNEAFNPPDSPRSPVVWAYPCPQCDWGTNDGHALRVHRSEHHLGAKIYACRFPGCKKKYHVKNSYLSHVKLQNHQSDTLEEYDEDKSH